MKTIGTQLSNAEWPIATGIGTADLSINNTEAVAVVRNFDADDLVSGATFAIRAFMTRANATPCQPIFRIRIGTTALTGNIAATLTSPADILTVGSEIEGLVTIRSAGAAGTALGSLKRTVHLAAVTVSPALDVGSATVAVDTTAANQKIALTLISGSASVAFIIRNAVIYRVN